MDVDRRTDTTQPGGAGRGTRAGRPEGLDWLGHLPSARPGVLLRLLAIVGRLVGFGILRFDLGVEGLERVPSGGCILACAMHRSWVDPLVLVVAFPLEPRIWYLGSGETTFRSRPREWLMRRLGGILPVWRGGTDLSVHVSAARAVLDAGALFAVFPEGSRRGGPSTLQPFRRGVGLIGLRTGAPILPVVLAGTHELYRGRRIAVRILEPTSALDLAGLSAAPAPGSTDELEAARAATEALAGVLAPVAAELAARCEDPPERVRSWRWLTHLVR